MGIVEDTHQELIQCRDPIEDAVKKWILTQFPFRRTDLLTAPFIQCEIQTDWLKRARLASQLSSRNLARRMGVAHSSYQIVERAEKDGRVQLKTLARAAEAMNCELVYAIRPKGRVLFGRVIAEALRPAAMEQLKHLRSEDRVRRLLFKMTWLLYQPKFRRDLGWIRNSNADPRMLEQFHDL